MNPEIRSALKLGGVGIFAAIVGLLLIGEGYHLSHSDKGGQVWFYDESQKKLYPMPVNTIPPDKGIGGPSGDGEKAVVVGFGKAKHDRSKWKIAYLLKYSPELKQILDKSIMARTAGKIFEGKVPGSQSEYFQKNTFVKRVGGSEWYPVNTPQAQTIMKEWRSWRGTDGSGPSVCPVE